jgi:hypothetical protein
MESNKQRPAAQAHRELSLAVHEEVRARLKPGRGAVKDAMCRFAQSAGGLQRLRHWSLSAQGRKLTAALHEIPDIKQRFAI